MSNDDLFGSGRIPVEPNAEARQGASAMFELYTAWVDAGFTPVQAMQLMIASIAKG